MEFYPLHYNIIIASIVIILIMINDSDNDTFRPV
jgi:hypothetical protein